MTEGSHQDHMVIMNVVKDLARPSGKAVPYLIFGAGANFYRSRPYLIKSSGIAWGGLGGGMGVKVWLHDRFFIGPQFRIGHEPNLRFSIYVGFGKRPSRSTGRDGAMKSARIVLLLVTPVVEYEFLPNRRINPYLVVGFGFTQYRTLEPNVEHYYDPSLPEFKWRKQGSINFTGGLGLRLFLGEHFFVAPEFRIGLTPAVHSTVVVGYAF